MSLDEAALDKKLDDLELKSDESIREVLSDDSFCLDVKPPHQIGQLGILEEDSQSVTTNATDEQFTENERERDRQYITDMTAREKKAASSSLNFRHQSSSSSSDEQSVQIS